MRLKYIIILLTLIALVMGCAKPPIAEMEAAREAVFRAENDADAVIYGSSSLARARDALRRMQEDADAKRYDAAKTNAEEAIAAAERAVSEGRAGAVRAREEAAALLAGLRPEIEETTRNVSAARYSQLDLDYDALERDLRSAHSTADQAEADQAAGRYQDAVNKAMIVRSDLLGINQKVANAVPRRK